MTHNISTASDQLLPRFVSAPRLFLPLFPYHPVGGSRVSRKSELKRSGDLVKLQVRMIHLNRGLPYLR